MGMKRWLLKGFCLMVILRLEECMKSLYILSNMEFRTKYDCTVEHHLIVSELYNLAEADVTRYNWNCRTNPFDCPPL